MTIAALIAGVGLLAYAADQFVLGAARVALIRNISPLVVGVVIIGFGTSAPELLVSGIAAAGGQPEIAVGNVVGSNIANLSLLLGVGAIIIPLSVASSTVRREAPIAVAAMVAYGIAVQGGISVVEGVILLAALALAIWKVSTSGEADPLGPETVELADVDAHSMRAEVARTVLGLIGTIAGAQLLLWGAVDLADRAGLGEGFVGATLVAIGTSLPELVTVVQSARRRETDLIVGNLLGSNMFNALGVGGVTGLIGAGALDDPELTEFGVLAAVGVGVLAWLMMRTGRSITRREGIALVVLYGCLLPFLS